MNFKHSAFSLLGGTTLDSASIIDIGLILEAPNTN